MGPSHLHVHCTSSYNLLQCVFNLRLQEHLNHKLRSVTWLAERSCIEIRNLVPTWYQLEGLKSMRTNFPKYIFQSILSLHG